MDSILRLCFGGRHGKTALGHGPVVGSAEKFPRSRLRGERGIGAVLRWRSIQRRSNARLRLVRSAEGRTGPKSSRDGVGPRRRRHGLRYVGAAVDGPRLCRHRHGHVRLRAPRRLRQMGSRLAGRSRRLGRLLRNRRPDDRAVDLARHRRRDSRPLADSIVPGGGCRSHRHYRHFLGRLSYLHHRGRGPALQVRRARLRLRFPRRQLRLGRHVQGLRARRRPRNGSACGTHPSTCPARPCPCFG